MLSAWGVVPAPVQAPSRQQVKWLRTTRTPIRRITFLPSCMPCKSTLSTAPAQLANRSAGAHPHEQHLAVLRGSSRQCQLFMVS